MSTKRVTTWHETALAFLKANRQKFKLKLSDDVPIYDSFGHVAWVYTLGDNTYKFTMFLYNTTMSISGDGSTPVDYDIASKINNTAKFTVEKHADIVAAIYHFEEFIVERASTLAKKMVLRARLAEKRGKRDATGRVDDIEQFTKQFGVSTERAQAAFNLADKHLPKGALAARKELAEAILTFAS